MPILTAGVTGEKRGFATLSLKGEGAKKPCFIKILY